MPDYFMTQTLRPSLYKHKARDQYVKTIPIMHRHLRNCCKWYALVVELTKKANIHYHIKCEFITDAWKLLYLDNVRRIGFNDCSIIKDMDKTTDYMLKDVLKTQEWFRLRPGEHGMNLKVYQAWTNDIKMVNALQKFIYIPIDICQDEEETKKLQDQPQDRHSLDELLV